MRGLTRRSERRELLARVALLEQQVGRLSASLADLPGRHVVPQQRSREPDLTAASELVSQGQRIAAVKLIQQQTGWSLQQALAVCDELAAAVDASTTG